MKNYIELSHVEECMYNEKLVVFSAALMFKLLQNS